MNDRYHTCRKMKIKGHFRGKLKKNSTVKCTFLGVKINFILYREIPSKMRRRPAIQMCRSTIQMCRSTLYIAQH